MSSLALAQLMQFQRTISISILLGCNGTTNPANEILEGKVIGLRSLHYKYFRSRSNPNNMIHLYDLTEDPLELHNIADVNIEIVENMETKLQNFLKNDNDEKMDEITNEERKKIEDELKKLGYI